MFILYWLLAVHQQVCYGVDFPVFGGFCSVDCLAVLVFLVFQAFAGCRLFEVGFVVALVVVVQAWAGPVLAVLGLLAAPGLAGQVV